MATKRVLMKGNEAIVKGAIAAGCRGFFGYPITPQNEIPEYMSLLMPKAGGVFLQAESEVAAINMVYGAAATGKRVMTSSSSPGVSLKQEGISYIAAAELPCVIVNVQRGGPGLGNIIASQADYFQSVKGGGHGDYKLLTLAPWSVTECYQMIGQCFDLADKYRNPALLLLDGIIGTMVEPCEVSKVTPVTVDKPWAVTGAKGRPKNVHNTLWMTSEVMEALNLKMQAKYKRAQETEVRYSTYKLDDAELVIVAYGATARICKSAIDMARSEGLKVGMFRPISLFPYPSEQILDLAKSGKRFLTVEMSAGQMVEDVRLAVNGAAEVDFYGRMGGAVPTSEEIYEQIKARLSACACEEVAR